jgi:hypothetical protein
MPYRRKIFGARSNEQNMIVIRPFCRRCAIVSALLPRSRYATARGPRIAKVSRYPLGDTLTWPPAPEAARHGAVATKKIGWATINFRSRSSSSA